MKYRKKLFSLFSMTKNKSHWLFSKAFPEIFIRVKLIGMVLNLKKKLTLGSQSQVDL